MSRINGEKARSAIQKKKRTADRVKMRAKLAAIKQAAAEKTKAQKRAPAKKARKAKAAAAD